MTQRVGTADARDARDARINGGSAEKEAVMAKNNELTAAVTEELIVGAIAGLCVLALGSRVGSGHTAECRGTGCRAGG